AADLGIDVDECSDEIAGLVAEHHDVFDEGRCAQAVLDELWRKRLTGAQPPQILEAIKEDKLTALVDTHGVAGAETVLSTTEFGGGGFILEIAGERATTNAKLAALVDPSLDRSEERR